MPVLSPPISFQAFNDDGSFMVGGLLYTYAAGTSTPKATYSDYLLASPNANPVVLNSRGEATLFLDGNYKYVLRDAEGELVKEQDDIRDITSNGTFTNSTLAGTLTVTSTAVTWSGNPTHSGNHTFANNVVVNGNTTLGDSSADTLTIAPSAITWSNDPTHSGDHTFSGTLTPSGGLVASGANTLSGATTISGDVTISATGGELRHGPNYTPTLGTITANVASSSANPHRWFRVGDCVTVQGSISVTPTAAAATTTQLGISLPIATNFASLVDVQAPAISHGNLGNTTGYITASVASDIVFLTFFSGSTSADTWSYTFVYEVKA